MVLHQVGVIGVLTESLSKQELEMTDTDSIGGLVEFWEKGFWLWYPTVDETNRYYGPAMRIFGNYHWYIHGIRVK
jgi:hypothetical protein